ncbi:MAG: HEAT repeat domain-containing protein [Acidobacteriia bacterium]|nr:HEAT repeat domain-containing protein [Terriglobia bacterium]
MKCKTFLIAAVLFASAVAYAQQTPPVPSNSLLPAMGPTDNPREDQLYKAGSDQLNQSDWQHAVDTFTQLADLKGDRADAGLYWKAYALNKLARRSDALKVIADLRRLYARSTWLKDAGALEVEIRQASGQPANPEKEQDEDLKLLALNGLMNSDSERAIPMLAEFLKANHSMRLKDRALFVLAQSDSPKAQDIVKKVAQGQSGPDLQVKAIHQLGITDAKEDIPVLQGIYNSASDPKVKRAVLQAFMTSDAKESVLAVLRSEKDPELRRSAIHQLGAMDAHSELRQLYQSTTSSDDKESLIQALAICDDVDTIAQIARAPGLRVLFFSFD